MKIYVMTASANMRWRVVHFEKVSLAMQDETFESIENFENRYLKPRGITFERIHFSFLVDRYCKDIYKELLEASKRLWMALTADTMIMIRKNNDATIAISDFVFDLFAGGSRFELYAIVCKRNADSSGKRRRLHLCRLLFLQVRLRRLDGSGLSWHLFLLRLSQGLHLCRLLLLQMHLRQLGRLDLRRYGKQVRMPHEVL